MGFLDNLFSAGVWGEKPPDTPQWKKWIHRNLTDNHCPECLMLDGCWFSNDKKPRWPKHMFCHCILEDIPYNDVLTKSNANCPYSKFDPYLFDPNKTYKHGKSTMLESWGYSISDSTYLKEEIAKQGLEKYINGDYALGLSDIYGQRINIRVELPRRNGNGTVSFVTGWMVRPNGTIQLNTPYGGK